MKNTNIATRMGNAKTRSNTPCALNPRQSARLGNPFASHDNEMTFKSALPIAQELKKVSGTRFSARYLVKVYQTPKALQTKLNWLRGCNGSIG